MYNLTSWSFADYTRGRVDVNRTHGVDYYHPAVPAKPLDSGTTHLSVQSQDGATVAVTSTINSLYEEFFFSQLKYTIFTLISRKLVCVAPFIAVFTAVVLVL